MADDIRQWEFGSPSGSQGGGGESGGQEGGDRKRQKEEDKSQVERADDARKKVEDVSKKAKRVKEEISKTPKRVEQAKEAGQKVAQGAKQAGEAAGRAAKAGIDAAKPAAEAARRVTEQAAIKTAEAAARVAVQVAQKTVQVGSKVVEVVVKLLANPYVLAAILLIVLLFLLFQIFMGSVNNISSLAGGSIFAPADYDNLAHRQIVDRLQQKMSGCDPQLVVYDGGKSDLNWQIDPVSGEHTSRLDIRLLKTLDYLTDRHRIRIDLLETGAPDIIRDSFLKKKAQYSPTGKDEVEQKETLSAFTTGQAMAITEIDRSKIPDLKSGDTACNAAIPAPIEVRWQRTVGEKTVRPIWEELAYDVGYLDQNAAIYQGITSRNDQSAIERVARAYQLSQPVDGAYDLYKETFQKLPRIVELIDRAIAYGQENAQGEQALDDRTLGYLKKARDNYAPLAGSVSGIEATSSENLIAEKIKELGSAASTAKLSTGARFVYKATQVKNSVNWDKKKKNGDLSWVKADEARNKIRQVIKELLEMPREISLEGTPLLFDENLMVKQIITFSPEDDLDNGLEGLDVFPKGIVAVDIGGVAIETLSVDAKTGKAVGDGKVDIADNYFSHAPIDNGVFSKNGTNYVYKKVDPNDPAWKKAGAFIWNYLSMPGQLLSSADKLHDLLVGGCVADSNETCRKVSYRDFLQVAF